MHAGVKSVARVLLGANLYRALSTARRAQNDRCAGRVDDARRAALYKLWVKPGDLVFDIGANIGNRTRVFADFGARVVAVEPLPHCYWALRWMFKFRPQVTIVGVAVSFDETPKLLTQFEIDAISTLQREWIEVSETSGRFGKLTVARELTVPCTTLDRLIERFGIPAFTKIDVEGSELDVLRGLSRPAGTLSFEFTPELLHLADQCLARLKVLGYQKFQFSAGESMAIGNQWLDATSLRADLAQRCEFGDVYALAP
jgi:FkbM family methyltransferase